MKCAHYKYRHRVCLTSTSAHGKHSRTQHVSTRRSEGATAVLAMMQAAVDELAQGPGSSAPGAAHAASNGITATHSDATLGALSC